MSAACSTGYVSRPTVPSCFCLAALACRNKERRERNLMWTQLHCSAKTLWREARSALRSCNNTHPGPLATPASPATYHGHAPGSRRSKGNFLPFVSKFILGAGAKPIRALPLSYTQGPLAQEGSWTTSISLRTKGFSRFQINYVQKWTMFTKPDEPNSIPRTHTLERESWFWEGVSGLHMPLLTLPPDMINKNI